MKIRELEHWPPQPSGSGKSFNLPLPQESKIEKVALDLKKILESSIGKSLLSIGNVDLPAN